MCNYTCIFSVVTVNRNRNRGVLLFLGVVVIAMV